MNEKIRLVRVTTQAVSMWKLLEGQIKFMTNYFDVKGISSPGERFEEAAKNEGIKMIPIYMYRSVSPLQDIVSIYKMTKVLKHLKPHIVHSHTPKAGLITMIAANIVRVPIKMHTIAGMPLESYKGWKKSLLSLIDKFVFMLADMVYPNSNGHYDYILEERLINPKKLKVLAHGGTNGVNFNHFCNDEEMILRGKGIRKELGFKSTDFLFMYAGRMVIHKGVEELIYAFDEFSKKDFRFKLIICGKNEPSTKPLKDDVYKILESNKQIHFLGYQNDIRPYYSLSDCFLFPSHREGLPNVLIQAAAMNLPIICSNILGNLDIVEHNKSGIIVKKGDVNNLLEAMEYVTQNPESLVSYAENAYTYVSSHYDQQNLWNAYLQEYKRLLEKKNIKHDLP